MANLEEHRRLLRGKLQNLKAQLQVAEQDVARLLEPPAIPSSDAAVQWLLASNDAGLMAALTAERASKGKQKAVGPGSELREDVFFPLRDGSAEARRLLGMFHCLQFEPGSARLVSRNLHVSRFSGKCRALNRTLFAFTVTLSVALPEEHVASFHIRISPWVRAEIGPFLRDSESTKAISHCMYGLAQYGNLVAKRQAVFEKLAQEHTAQDELWRRSPTLILRPFPSGLQLVIKWPISLDDMGTPRSRPSLSIRYPDALAGKLDSDTLRVRQVFDSLLTQHGVYSAVSTICRLLSKSFS